jgi:hypothetical protein
VLLETVVFVRKRVVVFKTVVLFETILGGREDDATDPVAGNARECIRIRTLSRCFERRRLLRRTNSRATTRRRKEGTDCEKNSL